MNQLIVLILVATLIFGTYLFQVGLLGVLVKEFLPMLLTMPIYFVFFTAYVITKMVS